IKLIDLNLLVALNALLEEQSVTRAAKRLALTQPTVSAMLPRLRQIFGDPLFVRSGHGILPTPRAQALAPTLKQWFAQAQSLVTTERFEPTTAEFTASLCANDYIQLALVVPFIQRLRRGAPNARLAVRSTQLTNVTAMLAEGELDLCVSTSGEIPSQDLPSRLLYEERYVCVVRKEHPLKARTAVSLDQFCRYPHVMVSPTEVRFVVPPYPPLAPLAHHPQPLPSPP